jgi:hypothetical protein
MNAAAQLAYDNRLPEPEDEGFLDTEAGQQWLKDSATDLIQRRDVTAPNALGRDQVLISKHRLEMALGEHMQCRLDPTNCVEQILIAVIRKGPDSSLYGLAVRAVGGPNVVADIAERLIAPKADEYLAAKLASDRVERECGF